MVLLDGTYHLLDATWAAGGCTKDEDGKLLSFVHDYDDYYWFTPADQFDYIDIMFDKRRVMRFKVHR